jgi:curved DNA-binding protein CbpA
MDGLKDYCELAALADSLRLYSLADAITHQLSIRTASKDIMERLAQVVDSPFYILGISPNATLEEAEEAYYNLIDEMSKRKRDKTRVEDFLIQRATWALEQISKAQIDKDADGNTVVNTQSIEQQRRFWHPKFPESSFQQKTNPEAKKNRSQSWWKRWFGSGQL